MLIFSFRDGWIYRYVLILVRYGLFLAIKDGTRKYQICMTTGVEGAITALLEKCSMRYVQNANRRPRSLSSPPVIGPSIAGNATRRRNLQGSK